MFVLCLFNFYGIFQKIKYFYSAKKLTIRRERKEKKRKGRKRWGREGKEEMNERKRK